MGKSPFALRRSLVTLVFGFLFFSFLASPALAENKIGINIGTQLEKFDQAAEVVGDGGWIVLIICPGDAPALASLISAYPKVNVIIRGHYPGQQLNRDWALSWVATLGQLPSTNKVYFMPWNEPNQVGSADWGSPAEIVSYVNQLAAFLNQAGLRGSKVRLLSPMINQSHPNFSAYVQELKKIDPNFFLQFDAIAMNLYDFGEEDCGQPLCSQSPYRNPARFADVLAEMGIVGKPVLGVESGTAGQNFYWKVAPASNSPLYRFVDGFRNAGVKMFAIPAYDLGGEAGHSWSLFAPSPDTANLMRAAGHQQGPCCIETASSLWNENFITSYGLVTCPNGVTVALDESYCSGCASPLQPRFSCSTPATGETDSRPNPCEPCFEEVSTYPFCAETPTVSQTFSFPSSAGPNLSFGLNGTFSVDLSSLEIPFVGRKGQENESRYLADFFEGTFFNYNHGQGTGDSVSEMFARSGVFQKLAFPETQDQLKREIVRRATGYAPNPVHDYLITNRDRESARLSEFLNNLKPEDPREEAAWKRKDDGKWFRLWPYVPMFSREDSPGQITFSIEPPGSIGNSGPFEIQVPHVARLYEVTKKLSEMLMPDLSQSSSDQPNTQNTSSSRFPPSRISFNNPAPPRTAASSTNLLANPNFEEGFSERGAGEVTVANGWEPWWRQGSEDETNTGYLVRPEYKPEDGETFADPLRVCQNRFGQKFFSTFSTHDAGFYQQVSVPATVPPNSQLTFSVWGLTWSSGANNPNSCAETGNYRLSVGIDPAGGTDPYSPNTVWSETVQACNAPTRLTVTATAQSSTVTVFTRGNPEWRVKHNDSYWDNACLVTGTSADLPAECSNCNATGGGGITGCEYPEATTGEGDSICVSGSPGGTISTQITATDNINHTPKTPEEINQCTADCVAAGGTEPQCYQNCAFSSHAVSRKIGITVDHPYLYETWKQTTNLAQGIFNIFRVSDPELAPPPDDETPAYGTVKYSFSGGSLDKNEAQFYFPFLEAVRKIKDWVAKEALAPRTTENN